MQERESEEEFWQDRGTLHSEQRGCDRPTTKSIAQCAKLIDLPFASSLHKYPALMITKMYFYQLTCLQLLI